MKFPAVTRGTTCGTVAAASQRWATALLGAGAAPGKHHFHCYHHSLWWIFCFLTVLRACTTACSELCPSLRLLSPSGGSCMKCVPWFQSGLLCEDLLLGNKPEPGLLARICFLLIWWRAVAEAAYFQSSLAAFTLGWYAGSLGFFFFFFPFLFTFPSRPARWASILLGPVRAAWLGAAGLFLSRSTFHFPKVRPSIHPPLRLAAPSRAALLEWWHRSLLVPAAGFGITCAGLFCVSNLL